MDGKTITFTVTVAGSGNVLTDVGVYALSVASTSANYVIKNPNGTVTITAPRKLVVTWNQTTFEDNDCFAVQIEIIAAALCRGKNKLEGFAARKAAYNRGGQVLLSVIYNACVVPYNFKLGTRPPSRKTVARTFPPRL